MAGKKLTAPKGAKRAGPIERTDAALGAAAARYERALPVRVVGKIAQLADQPPLIVGGIAVIAAGAALRRPRLLRTGMRMLASEVVATGAKALIKRQVARTRPGKMRKDGRYVSARDDHGDRDVSAWNSFPSGHTAGAVAVARAVTREYPAAAPLAGLAVAIVALVLPFTGAHFPGDVAAGGAIGLASEAAVDEIGNALA